MGGVHLGQFGEQFLDDFYFAPGPKRGQLIHSAVAS